MIDCDTAETIKILIALEMENPQHMNVPTTLSMGTSMKHAVDGTRNNTPTSRNDRLLVCSMGNDTNTPKRSNCPFKIGTGTSHEHSIPSRYMSS